MVYFLKNEDFLEDKEAVRMKYIDLRNKGRDKVPILHNKFFKAGDVLQVFYRIGFLINVFEGLCIALRSRNFKSVNTTFILRSVLTRIGVEMCFSAFYNHVYFYKINDYKRKRFYYNRSRLYIIRNQINRASLVK